MMKKQGVGGFISEFPVWLCLPENSRTPSLVLPIAVLLPNGDIVPPEWVSEL